MNEAFNKQYALLQQPGVDVLTIMVTGKYFLSLGGIK